MNESIVSWGQNEYDQVGGTPTGTGFTAIASSFGHSMALASNGSIESWGYDDYDVRKTEHGTATGLDNDPVVRR